MAFVSLGVNLPEVEISLALADVGSSPTWLDITPRVRAGAIDRGRENERERPAPGICRLTLSNKDGRFDPSYTAGPYYPNLVPRRRIRVQFRYAGVTYPAFLGYTEGWPQSWPASGHDSLVELVATDYFLLLAGGEFDVSQAAFPAELSNARVSRVLDAFGVPAGDRDIGTGVAEIVANATPEGKMLDHLLAVMESENGFLFIGRDGKVVFQGRRHRPVTEASSRATFADVGSGSGLRYMDIVPSPDDAFLFNDAQITPGDGAAAQQATDSTSSGRYGKRTYPKSLLVTANEAKAAAEWIVTRYKDPATRFESVKLAGASNPAALWPVILNAELSYRYTFKRTPKQTGQLLTQDGFVERMHHEFGPARFFTEWKVSPYGIETANWFTLDHATLGKLDSGGVLAY